MNRQTDTHREPRRKGIPLPRAHFLGLAPLDTWARLLWIARGRLSVKYALRLAFCLWTSFIGTVVTLPERIVLGPIVWWRFFRRGATATLHDGPPVVAVVGYYRSGTTHLHYLLSCDRRFTTPRWYQVASPKGWVLGWSVLRWAMLPMTPNRRPQDDVAFGPDYPAEDDFALAAWNLSSSLPWRFMFPTRRDAMRRWQFLEDEAARDRFRRTLAAFCWKLGAITPSRRLLLKSPGHTARVRELKEVFGDRIRFVHIVREPEAVIRSNTRMARQLEGYALESPPRPQDTRRVFVEEYARTDAAAREQLAAIGAGHVAGIRYQDLIADPVGEMERIYAELGLGWSDTVRDSMVAYLREVAAYRTADQKASDGARDRMDIGEETERERAVCARLRSLHHAAPAVEAKPLPEHAGPDRAAMRRRLAWVAVPLAAACCFGAWMGIAHWLGNRLDVFVWVWGTLIGTIAIRVARRGSVGLGLWCSAWFLVLVAASVYPLPEVAEGWTGPDRWNNIRSTYGGSINNNHIFILLGALAAWRYGSRTHAAPRGR
ncbi:MAG: sulfotransferase [Phycisphaerales bacterium]